MKSLPCLTALWLTLVTFGSSMATAESPNASEPKEPIEARIIGTWAVDEAMTVEAMKKRAQKEKGAEKLDEAELEEINSAVSEAVGLLLQFKPKGVIKTFRPGETDRAKYKFTKLAQLTGEFTMKVTPKGEDPDIATCRIQGDELFISTKDEEMDVHLVRLSEEKAKSTIADYRKQKSE